MLPRPPRRMLPLAIAVVAVVAIACGSASGTIDGDIGSNNDVDLETLFAQRLGGQWDTDFTIHSVDLGEFVSGGPPKDGIRSLDDPAFESVSEADSGLEEREPVIVVDINEDARAFPLRILTRHEIANTTIGDTPVTVTFCPLCNSAITFKRELNGVVHDFGVSGFLRNSDLVMYDRQTETWWQQFTGEAIVGVQTGALLDIVPSSVVSWSDFKAAHPDGQVLSQDTGFGADYGFNPYIGYDSDENPFLFRGEFDDRLSPIERVVAVELNDEAVAYPFTALEEERVVADTVGGEDIVVFYQLGTASALDGSNVAEGRDVGASGVFRPEAGGQTLTFRADGDDIIDNETNSTWSILGIATAGPLAGEELEPVVHGDHFWFAWAAFNPDTRVFGS